MSDDTTTLRRDALPRSDGVSAEEADDEFNASSQPAHADPSDGSRHAALYPSVHLNTSIAAATRHLGHLHVPRTFSALRNRNYRLYFFGQAVSLSGTWMQTTAQNWLVYQLTFAPFALGLLNFASQVPILLFSLFAGVVADRVNKQHMVIVTQTLAMIQAFVLTALVVSGRVTAWQVIFLAAVLGSINAFDNPARQSFVPEIVSKADLMNAIALNSTVFNTARILGPALGGIVVAAIGTGAAFTLNGLSFLAVLAGLLMMRVTPRPLPARGESMWRSLAGGLGYIFGNRALLTIVLQSSMFGIFGMSYATLMPVMADQILGLSVGGYGLLLSATGVGAVIGALTVASLGDYKHKGRLITLADFAFPTALFLFAASRHVVLSVLALVVTGVFMVLRNSLANTLVQISVPDELRGRVMSVYIFMFLGMAPLGAIISGTLAQQFGAPFALEFGAVALLGSALLIVWSRPEVRRLA